MKTKSYKLYRHLLRTFITFLKENKCYVQYRKNLQTLGKEMYGINSPSFFYLMDCDYETKEDVALWFKYVITHAFYWRNSNESSNFWWNIDNKWQDFLKAHYKNEYWQSRM